MTEKSLAKVEGQNLPAENLIQLALEKGAPIETMEKLMLMRRELKAEAAREIYFSALAKFQSELPPIKKTKAVYSKDKTLRYKYAPLEDIISQVKESLRNNGFSYSLKTAQTEKEVSVTCEAHHDAGHVDITTVTVPVETGGYMSDVQKIGSAITYAKRYAFCNAFGIMTADEDTDAASPEKGKPETVKTAKKTTEATDLKAEKARLLKYIEDNGVRLTSSAIDAAPTDDSIKFLKDVEKKILRRNKGVEVCQSAGIKIDFDGISSIALDDQITLLRAEYTNHKKTEAKNDK